MLSKSQKVFGNITEGVEWSVIIAIIPIIMMLIILRIIKYFFKPVSKLRRWIYHDGIRPAAYFTLAVWTFFFFPFILDKVQ
jgi:hypothetical protein